MFGDAPMPGAQEALGALQPSARPMFLQCILLGVNFERALRGDLEYSRAEQGHVYSKHECISFLHPLERRVALRESGKIHRV